MNAPTPSPSPRRPPEAGSPAAHDPQPVDLSSESVAGEEDPGSAIDLPEAPLPPSTPARDTPAR